MRLIYKKPFRQALEHLSGIRFSAFLLKDNKYYGTGRYIIEENAEKNKLIFSKNALHPESNQIENITAVVIPKEMLFKKLLMVKLMSLSMVIFFLLKFVKIMTKLGVQSAKKMDILF